jgi:hypothetical protein
MNHFAAATCHGFRNDIETGGVASYVGATNAITNRLEGDHPSRLEAS